MGGGSTPSSSGWAIPYPVLDKGVPHPVLEQGGTPSSLGLEDWMGYPTFLLLYGIPSIQTWDGVTPTSAGWRYPHPDLGSGHPISRMGYPSCLDLGWGTPQSGPGIRYPPSGPVTVPPISRMGYPLSGSGTGYSPHCKCGQTGNITFTQPSDENGNKS